MMPPKKKSATSSQQPIAITLLAGLLTDTSSHSCVPLASVDSAVAAEEVRPLAGAQDAEMAGAVAAQAEVPQSLYIMLQRTPFSAFIKLAAARAALRFNMTS